MMRRRQQSSTMYPVSFFMADSVDRVTGKTGLSPTVTLSKNGSAFGAAGGAVSEIANGWYTVAGNAGDRDTLGELIVHAEAAGADPADLLVEIVSYNPFADGVTLATAQANYAPAKPGDQMDMVESPNATAVTAIQSGLATGAALSTHDGKLDTVDTVVDAIKAVTDNLPNSGALSNLDAAVSSRSSHDAAAVRTEMDSNSTQLAAIVEDTGTTIPGLINAIDVGDGSVVVDHDTGGADALAYKTEGGVGIDNAVVRAYLKSDYDAGNTGAEYIKATTTTDVNGRWTDQMNLDPATYTLYYFKQGAYGPDTQEVTVE